MSAAWSKLQSTPQAQLWVEACSIEQAGAHASQATAASHSLKREPSSAISGLSSAHAACSNQKRLCHSSAAALPRADTLLQVPHWRQRCFSAQGLTAHAQTHLVCLAGYNSPLYDTAWHTPPVM